MTDATPSFPACSRAAVAALSGLRPARRGFTLFEVAISISLLTVVILSTMMLLPVALRSQQEFRYKIFASAKAMEMVDAFNSFHNAVTASDHEAPNAWDVHEAYRSQHPDLEVRLASFRFGLFPLPLDIAKRIDSDGDEIKAILDQGGYIYYSQPLATTGLKEDSIAAATPANETQRLIIGIVGLAQNNALYALPQKAWPYYTNYPSPPVHVMHNGASTSSTGVVSGGYYLPSSAYAFKWNGTTGYPWESFNTNDNDMLTVFKAYEQYQLANPATQAKAQAYCDAAVAYCQAKTLPAGDYDGVTLLTDFQMPVASRFVEVNALRFLAHAAACRLHFGAGVSGTLTISQATVDVMHENCMRLGMKFQATYPYDWGCPRPTQRALMVDHPLIEYDLGSPLLSGTIFGAGVAAQQWKPVSAQTITHIGVNMDFPSLASFTPAPPALDPATTPNIWGDTSHFTLTALFEPAERCRQIVFWSADWQSYEDFETAPSAPVDASKYLKGAPIPGRTFAALMTAVGFADRHQYMYRNPEKPILFNTDMTAFPSGTPTPYPSVPAGGSGAVNYNPGELGNDNDAPAVLDQGSGSPAVDIFSGRYGADRNRNLQLDRGPVPKAVRMRATLVARFNYYDPRLHAVIR
jgi:hypothetical protein